MIKGDYVAFVSGVNIKSVKEGKIKVNPDSVVLTVHRTDTEFWHVSYL